MNKLNIVNETSNNGIRIKGGLILLGSELVTVDKESLSTLETLEKNLILRNWNIWPRVFIYSDCIYYNFDETCPNLLNPLIYSGYDISNSVKFSTARKLRSSKKITDSSSNSNRISPVIPSSVDLSLVKLISSTISTDVSAISLLTLVISTESMSSSLAANSYSSAIVSGKSYDIKYSDAVTEETVTTEDGEEKTITFNDLYSEIMNLIDNESDTGVSMYYHLTSLYDLIKLCGVVDVVVPGSPIYTSAINLSKYVRANCICHVTISYLSGDLEAQKQIKFNPVNVDSTTGQITPAGYRFEVKADDESIQCIIECQDFCVRVFPCESNECIITNCYITYNYEN